MAEENKSDKIKVRFSKKSEMEAVNAIRKQVHMVHANGRPDIFRRKFGRKLAEHIYEFFRGDQSRVVVAKSGGEICGFASIEVIQKPRSPYNRARSFLRVTEFGVDIQHRRQGIGMALMHFIKQYAAEKGLDTVELDVWEFNKGALKFYESQGFTTYRRYMEFKM